MFFSIQKIIEKCNNDVQVITTKCMLTNLKSVFENF